MKKLLFLTIILFSFASIASLKDVQKISSASGVNDLNIRLEERGYELVGINKVATAMVLGGAQTTTYEFNFSNNKNLSDGVQTCNAIVEFIIKDDIESYTVSNCM